MRFKGLDPGRIKKVGLFHLGWITKGSEFQGLAKRADELRCGSCLDLFGASSTIDAHSILLICDG